MNFIYDHSEQIHKLKWNLAHSVSDCDISDLKLRMMHFLEKEMIFGSVNFWQAVSVSVHLIGYRTL